MKRSVVIMTSFGGRSAEGRRLAVIQFLRIRFLIENHLQVRTRRAAGVSEELVSYEVSAVYCSQGEIQPRVLRHLREADVVLGLLTASNPNVIYELAVRSILRDEMVLVTAEDVELPMYFNCTATIPLCDAQHESHANLERDLGALASSENPPLSFNSDDSIPDAIRRIVDYYDAVGPLRSRLQAAFQEIEDGQVRRQQFAWEVMRKLEPSELAGSWIQYYPSSVIQVEWSGRSGPYGHYLPRDVVGEAHVCSCNRRFLDLYNIAELPANPHILTRQFLLDRLRGRVSDGDLDLYDKDQQRLVQQIVFENSIAYAEVPIRFEPNVPNFAGLCFKPILVGRTIVGAESRNHRMYLHVIYIEVSA